MTTPLSTFEKFPELPTEIRLKIWGHACHQPRNVDLWTSFLKCEIDNTIFYTQYYESKLTRTPPPKILQINQEARAEGLKHYRSEFETQNPMVVSPSKRKLVVSYPGFYFNFEAERICPRGNYNIVSMDDFLKRVQGLRNIAIDLKSHFYLDLANDYLMKNIWPFESLEDVILYDGTGTKVFEKDYKGGKVELGFEDLEKPSPQLEVGKDKIEGAVNATEKRRNNLIEQSRSERESSVDRESIRALSRPHVRFMKLVVR